MEEFLGLGIVTFIILAIVAGIKMILPLFYNWRNRLPHSNSDCHIGRLMVL